MEGMQNSIKDTQNRDVIVSGGSPVFGNVSFKIVDAGEPADAVEPTFILTAKEARKLVKLLDDWV